MNKTCLCMDLCRSCYGLRQLQYVRFIQPARAFSITPSLHKFQNKYQYKMKPDEQYAGTYRLLKGESMTGKTYGPLVDMPDYSFLDGRPTPLTPAQRKEREKRKLMATKMMSMLEAIDKKKAYSKVKQIEDEEQRRQYEASKLTEKGHRR